MENSKTPEVLAVAATGNGAQAPGGRSTPFEGISHIARTRFSGGTL
jgi:hypothetical protein